MRRLVFARLPMPVNVGDRVDLGPGFGWGTVETGKVADDFRDAKCTVRLDGWRDHNGERGPVPTDFRAHDWQTCRVLRDLADRWRWRRERDVVIGWLP